MVAEVSLKDAHWKSISYVLQTVLPFIFIIFLPNFVYSYINLQVTRLPDPPEPMILDSADHDMNQVFLRINNNGVIGLDITTGNGTGFWPKNTANNYVYGSGLWFGGKADVDDDGDLDKVFVQGYNPLAGDTELDPGRVGQDPDDPLARIFDSTDSIDLTEWPDEFRDPGSGEPVVISPQDLVTIYNDVSGEPVFGMSNLGIEVQQRSMAFIHDLSINMIYFEWDMTNVSDSMPNGPYTFEDAWIGYDMDADVGVAFGDDLTSFFREIITPVGDTLTIDAAIVWDSDFSESNFTGIPGFMGLAFIQTPGNDADGIDNDGDGLVDESPFNGIDDDGDGEIDEQDEVDELGLVNFSKHCSSSQPCSVIDPETDQEGYDILSCISEANPDSSSDIFCLESTTSADIRFMISSGPFDWLPGQTIRVRFAFVFADPVGTPTSLDFVGDPPRPDPNDPVLANFITSVLEARSFARSGYTDYGTLPAVNNATNFLSLNIPFFNYPVAVSIYDTVGLARASLFYSTNDGAFEEIDLTYTGGYLYEAELPGPGFESRVDLFYEVVDSLYRVTREPEDAPQTTFGYDVVHLPVFTNVTEEAGFNTGYSNQSGMAVADYDNDGDQDIYLVNHNSSVGNDLYRNNGDGTFSIVTNTAGLGNLHTFCAAWADYDNDGNLDLFVTDRDVDVNYLFHSNGDGTFTDLAESAGVILPGNIVAFSWGDYNSDGFVDLYLFRQSQNSSERNALFRNNGDGSFTDVAQDAGLDFAWSGSYPAYRVAIWVDVDNDGWQDLCLSDPTTLSARMFRNNRDETFSDIAGSSDLIEAYSNQIMFSDYDNDGDLDLITEGWSSDIYENLGDGRFDSVGELLNIEGGIFLDTDNSGFLDVLLNVDYMHSRVYLNEGGEFKAIDGLYGTGRFAEYQTPLSLDYDNDGDLDFLCLDYKNVLFRNEGFDTEYTHNWIHVKCEGTTSNRAAIGAKVKVTTGELTQTRVVGGARSKVQSSLLVEFGLGDAEQIDRMVVEWPSGKVQEVTGLAVNQIIAVIEDSTLVGIGGGSGNNSANLPRAYALAQNYPNPFNPSTTIRYDIPGGSGSAQVKVFVYDLRGRLVKGLVDEEKEPGRYQVHWNGRDDRGGAVSSGVYLYRIEAGNFTSVRKMVLVR